MLVDEINRAMPRTQSALLEAMAEGQVTVDGVTHPLPAPFLVIATENPIEQEGTFPLPEAQLDRFALRSALGYPDEGEEVEIVLAQRHGHPIDDARARASTLDDVARCSAAVEDVYVDELIAPLDRRPRARDARGGRRRDGRLGARQPHARANGARVGAPAWTRPRRAPEDVEALFLPVLGHRLLLTASFLAETRTSAATAALEQIRSAASSSRRRPHRTGKPGRARPPAERCHPGSGRPFPLVPRRRPVGLPFGDLPSRRRGHGSDIIGTRPYEIGDPVATIDWFASARLSAATGRDEFIVRDHAADEAPRVAFVTDRRPAMGIYGPPLPWLSKPRALAEAPRPSSRAQSRRVPTSRRSTMRATRGRTGCRPDAATCRGSSPSGRARRAFGAPDDNVAQALAYLGQLRSDLPTGSFLFVLSDFLVAPAAEAWLDAIGHGWDVVPVVIQDPTWEQSFPDVGSVVVPFAEPRSGTVGPSG